MIVDAHIHLADCLSEHMEPLKDAVTLSSSSSPEELTANLAVSIPTLLLSAGVHPWFPNRLSLDEVEQWAQNGIIRAIGECGLDLYPSPTPAPLDLQKKLFAEHIAIAKCYRLPLVIHERKALREILAFSTALRQLPAVIFHSWTHSPEQLFEVLQTDIPALFSVGAFATRRTARSFRSVAAIPSDRLLIETDAPFQPPAGLKKHTPSGIFTILRATAEIIDTQTDVIEKTVEKNFRTIFPVR